MQCDMRVLTPAVTSFNHFATIDLAAGAWPETFEIPGKAIRCL